MFTYPKFDVEITREIDPETLGWPERGKAQDDSGLGGNRCYADLRGLTWDEADRVARLECELVARIESASDPVAEYAAIEDELYETDADVYGLDLGVASAVIALSAVGCVPCASCNAGAFGGSHHEGYPLVVFFARPAASELLLEAAAEAEIGIAGGDSLVAYADDIRKMMRFASCMRARSSLFRAARSNIARPVSSSKFEPERDTGQSKLDFGS